MLWVVVRLLLLLWAGVRLVLVWAVVPGVTWLLRRLVLVWAASPVVAGLLRRLLAVRCGWLPLGLLRSPASRSAAEMGCDCACCCATW